MVQLLLDGGAIVNATDTNEKTPIHIAVSNNFQEGLREMKKLCPNFGKEENEGLEILRHSVSWGRHVRLTGLLTENVNSDPCAEPQEAPKGKLSEVSIPLEIYPWDVEDRKQEAPTQPNLLDISCQDRIAKFTWIPGSDPGYQPTLSYTLFHKENNKYRTTIFNKTHNYSPDKTIYTTEVDLTPWTTNSFWVTGHNNAGSSPRSRVRYCRSPPEIPSENPSNIRVSQPVPNVLLVEWKIVPRENHNGPGFRYLVSWQKDGREKSKSEMSEIKDEIEHKLSNSSLNYELNSGENSRRIKRNFLEEVIEDIHDYDKDGDNDEENESEEEAANEENVNDEEDSTKKIILMKKQNMWNSREINDWTKSETQIEVEANNSYLIKIESWNDLGQALVPELPVSLVVDVQASQPENSTDDKPCVVCNNVESSSQNSSLHLSEDEKNMSVAINNNTIELTENITKSKTPLPNSSSTSSPLHADLPLYLAKSNEFSMNESGLLSLETTRSPLPSTVVQIISTTLPSKDDSSHKKECSEKRGNFAGYNWTLSTVKVNKSLEILCPRGLSGSATWRCLPNGEWSNMPDISNCSRKVFDKWMTKLETSHTAAQILLEIAKELSKTDLSAGDISDSGGYLSILSEKHVEDLTKIKSQVERKLLAEKYVYAAAKVAEETLRNTSVWKNLQEEKIVAISNNIQEGLYNASAKVVAYLRNETKDIINENIAIRASNQPATFFSDPGKTYFVHPNYTHTKITLPSNFYKGYEDKNKNVKVLFMAFNHLNCINNSVPCSPDKTKPQLDVEAKAQVNSAVIGAKIGNAPTWHAHDGKNVVIQLEHIYSGSDYNLRERKCVWWDSLSKTWSEQGCCLTHTEDDYSVCHCNHLTNFAVIMDIGSVHPKNTELYKATQMITLVGCYASIFSLVLCIICFLSFNKTSKGKIRELNFSRMNLCLCLLLAKVVLLFGLDATHDKSICTVVAIMLHYLFLATLTWSAIEAFHLYRKLTKVFNTHGSRRKTFLVVGYLGPLCVVSVSFLLSNFNGHWTDKGYGTDKACWLSHKMIWAFAGIALPILLVNLSVFVLALKAPFDRERKRKKDFVKGLQKINGMRERVIPKLAGSISIFLFLCLTWLSGYFYFAKGTEAISVIFTLFNSFSGVLMFIFSILLDESIMVQNKKIKKQKNKETNKSKLTKNSLIINKKIMRNANIKRRTYLSRKESRTDARCGTERSLCGSSTTSSEETYIENVSSLYNSSDNLSSVATISSRSCLKSQLISAIVHSGSIPNASSQGDDRWGEDDFSVHEVSLSPSRLSLSFQNSSTDKEITINVEKLAYLKPDCVQTDVSLGVTCDAAKAQYEKSWNALHVSDISSWEEKYW